MSSSNSIDSSNEQRIIELQNRNNIEHQENQVLQEKCKDLAIEITKKEETIQNLENKVTGVVDKLREFMQKYAELKNKNSSLEKMLETMPNEMVE